MTIVASRTLTIEQSPQEVSDWLYVYHKTPWYRAFQTPLPVPKSAILVLKEPVLDPTGKPHLRELIDNESAVIVFEFKQLHSGHTKVNAICFVEEWTYYLDELVHELREWSRQEEKQEEAKKGEVEKVDPTLTRLTKRQQQVYLLVLEGKDRQEIADELTIAARTVDTNIQNICERLELPIAKSIKELREWLKK